MVAAARTDEQLVVGIGRGHRDHVRIGGRIERGRFWSGIARGGDQNNALLGRRGKGKRKFRVARTREAHIDDARAIRDRPIDALEDGERRASIFIALAGRRREGADRQNARCRRHAGEQRMRRDGARHAGPMTPRRFRPIGRIEAASDDVAELWMFGIDAIVDHRNEDAPAGGEPVRFGQTQLRERVLILARGTRLRLLQRVTIVRLRYAHAGVAFERANDIGDRALIADLPPMERSTGEADGLRFHEHQAMSTRQRIKRLRREIGRQRDQHFGRHEALFTGERNAARSWWLRARQALAELILRIASPSGDLPIDRALRVSSDRVAHCAALAVVESFNGNSIGSSATRATDWQVEA